jgi:hypothetical protein
MPTNKEILNSLRCPICKAQVDGNNYSIRFYCVYVRDHYNIWLKDGAVKRETVNIYDMSKLLKYEITQSYENNSTKTNILLENIDAEGREIFTFDEVSYKADIALFDFKNFNSEKALNKVKTFLVFR